MASNKRYSPYRHALLDPIAGPLVGVPTSVPVDTHRTRLKATTTVTIAAGTNAVFVANPYFALCSDQVPVFGLAGPSGSSGAFTYANAPAITAVGGPSAVSNAQYTRSQFAGLTTLSSVRGRVVSACFRICNVSAANTRNGVFTLFKDPQHNTLQGRTAASVASDQKAQQFNASTSDWHTVTYHPVDPEEVDGWVWDPAVGPQAGVKTGAYTTGNPADGSSSDSYPGYMGIWWNGDAVSQTFQVEMYVIAEYVGSLVQPLIRSNEAESWELAPAHHDAENSTVHASSGSGGAASTNHPGLLGQIKHAWDSIPRPIRDAAQKRAEDYIVSKIKGGIGKKIQTGAMIMAPEFAPEIAAAGMLARRTLPYAKALGRAVANRVQNRPYATRNAYRGAPRRR